MLSTNWFENFFILNHDMIEMGIQIVKQHLVNIAELEGRLTQLSELANEHMRNSNIGVTEVLQHRVASMEESLKSLVSHQAAILEHVRASRPNTPAPAAVDTKLNFRALREFLTQPE